MLTRDYERSHWRALGLAAGALSVSRTAVVKLLDTLDTRDPDRFIDSALERGLLKRLSRGRASAWPRASEPERLAIGDSWRSLVLRQLASEGALREVTELSGAVDTGGSPREFVHALFLGELSELERSLRRLPWQLPKGEDVDAARTLLREAICAPFDAGWLTTTWRDDTETLVEQVLVDALGDLATVGRVYDWALGRADKSARLCRVLAQHALLRGRIDDLAALAEGCPEAESFGLLAARAFALGDLVSAQSLLDRSLGAPGKGAKSNAAPALGSVAPLLALLLLSRERDKARKQAKRLLDRMQPTGPLPGWPPHEGARLVARALRTLLKNLTRPEADRQRLSVHQLPASAPGWQLILLALDVYLHDSSPIVRAGWAERLKLESRSWTEAGYHWLALQASSLARALAPEQFDHTEPPVPGGSLWVADLLQAKPEWQKSLDAVAAFVKTAAKSAVPSACRVAWFVDMASGELARPALEEFRVGSGWSRGRRIDIDELCEMLDRLPPEDAQVVRCADQRASTRKLGPEALQALVGHPRVYNGARGALPIEVVRGECRVETREEHGHLLVSVEPANAKEGINVVVESEARLKVVRVDATMAELTRLLPGSVRIPASRAHDVLPLLGRLADHVPVHSERLSAHKRIVADPTPCLRISPEAGAFFVELGVRPFGPGGRFVPAGSGRAALTSYAQGELISSERDLELELRLALELGGACSTLRAIEARESEEGVSPNPEPRHSWVLGEEDLYALLQELEAASIRHALEWQNLRPVRARGRLGVASLKGKLRCVKGWYLASGTLRLDTGDIDLAELVRMPYTRSGRFIRLPSGDFIEVERRVRRVLKALAAYDTEQPKAGPIRVPSAALGVLEEIGTRKAGFDLDSESRQWLEHVRATLAEEPPLPAGLVAALRPYQVEGYRWLWRLGRLGLGACLADDMGLGKTVQTTALLLERQGGGPALVVAPTSVCGNWLAELERFAPGLKALEYAGKRRADLIQNDVPNADVLVTSYSLLQQDTRLAEVAWHTVVLDEAQFIKNPHSARARAAFGLDADFRLALTGTPVENHLGDLWSIFRFLNPALLGRYKDFFHYYLRPIERDCDAERRGELKRLLGPFLLRRTKKQVLSDLPPLTTVRHEVRPSKDETTRYALLKKQIHEKLRTVHGKREHKLQILAEITRLRRFCCHPRLVFPDASADASKLATLLELAHELRENGHRALVFSQFVDFLTLVREQLDEHGFTYQYLDGSVPAAKRSERIAAFQEGQGDLFLLSLKAGGFGLNLAAADYVIQLDPWWNPAVEAQATDRAHRIGQERPVTVYRLLVKDSIEERIEELQRDKQSLATSLLDGSDIATRLGVEQLLGLLS